MKLIEQLNWRYATKRYTNQKVSDNDVSKVIEAMRLSASSGGLQPYRVFMINNEEIRKELGAHSFNHQITEASHLIGIAAFSRLEQKHIEDYLKHMAYIRKTTMTALKDLRDSMENFYLKLTDEEVFNWASRQAYIALGTGLIAAAELNIDSSPLEGFDAEKLDGLLGLKEKNLKSVVLFALGYRDETKDPLGKAKKVRLHKNEFVQIVS